MDYKITMPQLSDSMSEGKLVEWKVKVGDEVHSGDVIADIESDKAVIEVQTFKDGVVKELKLKENEEAKVGSVIAVIDTDTKAKNIQSETKPKPKEPKQEPIKQEPKSDILPKEKNEDVLDILFGGSQKEQEHKELSNAQATPVAKMKAKKYGLDIEELQKSKSVATPTYGKDIDEVIKERYFSPKAIKLIDEYGLDVEKFKLDHKIGSDEVLSYIKSNNIPKTMPLTTNQRSVVKTIVNSWQKPIYHIFEEVLVERKEGIKLTANIIKALAKTMQKYPLSRAKYEKEGFKIFPGSNISVALSRDEDLYMVVIKNAQELSLNEMDRWLREIKSKKLSLEDLSGSTFGISNLGMFGIESFDALLNGDDVGMAAFGRVVDKKMRVVFTFDHRVINGAMGAKFVMDFKEELKNV